MKLCITISFFILLFVPVEVLSQSASNDITTFILVRHAEKADDTPNPNLSPEGYERSDLLGRMLTEIEFNAVYSTPYIRTVDTVRRIAEQNQIDIIEYQPGEIETLAADLLEKHQGGYVLIAGHSNTTPGFANALLGREEFTEKFDETDFDNILIVTIPSDGRSNLLHLKY